MRQFNCQKVVLIHCHLTPWIGYVLGLGLAYCGLDSKSGVNLKREPFNLFVDVQSGPEKKRATLLVSISSPKINRLSKFFY